MSLHLRGKVWWSYFYIDGVRYQRSTGTRDHRKALRIERKLQDDVIARKHQLVEVNPRKTFGELVAEFLARADVRPHHLDRLKVLLPYFAEVTVIRITKSMTEEYRRWRKAQKRVSDATINRDLSVLRHILYWGVDESLLLTNPLSRLRLVPERRLPRRILSVADETKLLAAAAPHLGQITTMALYTGMRRGEILNQRWEHVDLSRRVLSVSKSKTAAGEAREIPLADRIYEMLAVEPRDEGYLFLYKGQPLHRTKTAWKAALRRSEVRHLRFHDLRHTFNTRLMEAGVLQEVRMALMGHTNPQRVHSSYTHVELPVKREAIARLEQWVEHQQQLTGGNDG